MKISRENAHTVLDAIATCLDVDKLGVRAIDSEHLNIVGCSSDAADGYVTILSNDGNRMKAVTMPDAQFNDLIKRSVVQFKYIPFISFEDVAWHLRLDVEDVEETIAKTLLARAISGGLTAMYWDLWSAHVQNPLFKPKSLEEVFVTADLSSRAQNAVKHSKREKHEH